ncbi:hypothetical protein ElyMa_002228500 [Elysia marginata]|uniref:Uncharacterized protein n=1 Tax=Elysia marginata TaxID=1093978 RepID=A0AAV4FWF9_9GAST|nr:hypothetical protein ElyMa_002228500 [Elysia marginata]
MFTVLHRRRQCHDFTYFTPAGLYLTYFDLGPFASQCSDWDASAASRILAVSLVRSSLCCATDLSVCQGPNRNSVTACGCSVDQVSCLDAALHSWVALLLVAISGKRLPPVWASGSASLTTTEALIGFQFDPDTDANTRDQWNLAAPYWCGLGL